MRDDRPCHHKAAEPKTSISPPSSAKLTRGRTDIGAVVSFVGICRGGEGADAIEALTLEHYPGMADEEIARHVE